MGTISSGVGLISGIDHKAIIDQLVALEAKPRTLVQQRVAVLQAQKAAFLDINARLLAVQTAATNIGKTDLFSATTATSSNTAVLSASAGKTAAVGTYSFTVDRLVSSHQIVTRGFTDADATAIGTATTLRFESAKARLDGDTRLTQLNAESGVQRGKIRITDRSGASAEIDLTKAVTVNDVLDAINNNATINIKASLDGDRLLLTDLTGQAASNLIVQEVGSTATAAQLGIAGNSAGSSTLTGSQINRIGSSTQLANLNDGLGVRILGGGQNDFSITDSLAGSFNVKLEGAVKISDVIDKINTAAGGAVTASIAADGVSLKLVSAGGGTVTVAALNSSNAAKDLGILGASTGDTLSGDRVLAKLGSKLLRNVSGGSGVTAGVIDISGTAIDLSSARSITDVIAGINAASGTTNVTAALNSAGNGITLTHATTGSFTVADTTGSLAANLNLAGSSTNGKIESGDRDLQWIGETTRLASLNSGKGITRGKFKITDSSGASATVDLTQGDEVTLKDVIKEINSRGIGVVASINSTGDGLLLTNTAGGAGKLRVEESGSSTARDLGILGSDDDNDGVINGAFEKTVSILATDKLNDIVTKINSAGIFASASVVNDGSGATPYRLNISSKNSGVDGRILFDDGGLSLGGTTLVKGDDALVLFGSSNASEALLLTASSNTLTNTVAGVTINLLGTSSSPVQLTVARNDESAVSSISTFVTAFNGLIDTLNKYDKYDAENKTKGVLLGDGTVGAIRNRVYSVINARINASGRYNFMTQVGLTVGEGAKLQLDKNKLTNALADNNADVVSLFTATSAAVSTSDLPSGVTVPGSTTKQSVGFGPRTADLVKGITDIVSGTLTLRTKSIDDQVTLNNTRITELTKLLAAKRERLEQQFSAMENALSLMQQQSSALASLANAASLSTGR